MNFNSKFKLFNLIKILFLAVLFFLAMQYEQAQIHRIYVLTITFLCFLLIGIFRVYLNKIYYSYSFLIDIGLVFFLEHNSRFLLNYFFHSFYIIIIIEVSLYLKRKESIILGLIAVIFSTIKYILLVYYNYNLSSISQMIFFLTISIFILVVINLLKHFKKEKEKNEKLYKELAITHKKLKEYTKKVEELTVIEERNKIAREIHDTLGHSMTSLIMQMEMASHILDKEPNKAKDLINEGKKSARDGLLKVREVVETLKPNKEMTKGIESIIKLIDEFSKKCNVIIKKDIDKFSLPPDYSLALYRIIQESLTNSLRHGKANNIKIKLKKEDKIYFEIKDNGKGSKKIKKGYGLKGIKERVKSLNGNVEFISENGFIVKGYIPMGGKYD
ncbi:MAG: sensor histidine kinase [Firmicutes bacterium]|nr:sensor histidine kinase [Bacillota bacterium]